jgi:LemA protein
MFVIIIVSTVLVVFLAFLIVLYNGFVAKKNMVDEAFSGIDVILKKRFDLIPNLIQTVKGYANHESETLENIVNLRNKAVNAQGIDEKMQLDKTLSQSVNKIFALAENYPDLKANTNFLSLQDDLSEIETDIERSKRYYNGTVRDYNIVIESFPGNIIANSFGFSTKNFFELADVTQRETPKIQF